MAPASIRYKNPGAMWGRTGARPSADRMVPTNAPIPKRWGSRVTYYLSDGLGQGNNIAAFDTWVDGICAQLDLWRSSKNYRNRPFNEAIHVWSGGNNVESYIQFVLKRVPGMTRTTIMNDSFWRGPMGIGFLKAQAWHEAGQEYPAPEGDWAEAQRRVFSKIASDAKTADTIKKTTTAGGAAAAGGAGAVVAAANGANSGAIFGIIFAGLIIGAMIFIFWHMIKKENAA